MLHCAGRACQTARWLASCPTICGKKLLRSLVLLPRAGAGQRIDGGDDADSFIGFSRAGTLSPDGQYPAWDAGANQRRDEIRISTLANRRLGSLHGRRP